MRATLRLSPVLLAFLLAAAGGCRAAEEPQAAEPSQPSSAEAPLVVASFGGAWQAAQRKAIFDPFAKQSGIEVKGVEYDGQYTEIRDQGAAGEWDVVDVEPVELLRGSAAGIYEPIDYSGIDPEVLPQSARHPDGVALMTYSILQGYSTDAFPEAGSAPSTWADFWDLERFPGQRALRSTPEWMLEIALLADGVPPDQLYPIDLDRAFRSLEKIEDAVVFYDSWAEPAEWLASGKVALAVGTNGRLEAAREAGEPIEISWHGGLVSSDYLVIPAGSKNKARAQELVRYAVGQEAQSAFPRLIDYGPVNRRAMDALPGELLKRLPSDPAHVAESAHFDAAWWLEHEDEAHQRYEAWMKRLAER